MMTGWVEWIGAGAVVEREEFWFFYLVGFRHGVETVRGVGEQSAGFADLVVVGRLVRDEILPGVLGCFEQFRRDTASDHLDVLL